MTVAHILEGKAGGIVTLAPGSSVRDALKLLSEKRIGTVVVSSNGTTVAGILSERDIVRELAERGAEILDDPVDALMTSEVQTCTSGESVRRLLERMTEGRFRHMPVVEQDRLIGMVSLGDAVKYRLEEVRDERNALRDFVAGA